MSANRIAILGLGVEGVSLCNFFDQKKDHLTVLDKASKEEILARSDEKSLEAVAAILENNQIDKKLGNDYLDNLAGYDVIYRSPGIYFNDPKIVQAGKRGAIVSSQIGLFFELCPCQIIGVTGTKGKGTTATLIFEIIQEARKDVKKQGEVYLAGNIGYPAITLIPKLKQNDLVVLELSNFQLADLKSSPHIAVITNLGIDHLDYHPTVSEYQNTKRNILNFQTRNDYAVLNLNSTFEQAFLEKTEASKCYFSDEKNLSAMAYIGIADGEDAVILKSGKEDKLVVKESEIKLVGKHNLENIAAAAIVADILQISVSIVRRVAQSFLPLPYRLELVREIDGVKYINDSFATNPGPTMAAVKSFREDKIMILGGSSKGSDFTELANLISNSNVKAVVLIGAEGPKIKQALRASDCQSSIIGPLENLDDALKSVREIAKTGDIVLFSPACASFGMFKNYKDRGQRFKQAVENL